MSANKYSSEDVKYTKKDIRPIYKDQNSPLYRILRKEPDTAEAIAHHDVDAIFDLNDDKSIVMLDSDNSIPNNRLLWDAFCLLPDFDGFPYSGTKPLWRIPSYLFY